MTVHIQSQSSYDLNCAQDEFISIIASHLEELVKKGEIQESLFASQFDAEEVPKITLLKYLQRIMQWTFCGTDTVILAYIYIYRLEGSEQVINNYCIHRILFSSLVVAIKYQEENYYQNQYYARVGGIPVEELNKMEKEFLQLIDYQLYVDETEFEHYKLILSLDGLNILRSL